MTDKTISEDFAVNPVTWDGAEIIPVVKTLGSPATPDNAAGLASTLRAWIMSLAGLSDLRDVNVAGSPTPVNGQVLTYHAATQKWISSTPASVSTTLAALTDTDVAGSPSPANGQVLTWSQTLAKWIASTLPASSASLAGLTDTDIAGSPSPANGQTLTYSAALQKWVAATPSTGGSTTLAGLTDVDVAGSPSPTDGQVLTYNASLGKWISGTRPVLIQIACSDETTLLTAGTAKITFRWPYAFTLTDVRGSLTDAATGGTLLAVDVNQTGSTILSTKLTFDASEKTTTTAATPRVISNTAMTDDAEVTVDIDAIGSTLAGKGLKLTFIGTKP